MTFAQPENFTYFAAVLIVPLLYLVRRRSRLAPVPHLFLWERALASQGHSRRSRIHDLLGFLLNLLILSSLACVAALPQAEISRNVERPTLLVIDNSLSMSAQSPDGTKRSARARERAREALPRWAAEGPIALAYLNQSLDYLNPLGSSLAAVEASLASVVDGRGDLDVEVLQQFVEGMREREPDLRVILISDGAFEVGESKLAAAAIELLLIPATEGNVALVNLRLIERRGADFKVEVGLQASGQAMMAEVVMTDSAGGTTRAPVELAAGEVRQMVLSGRQVEAGFVSIEVHADGDALAVDDRLEFFLERDPRLRLLVVADEVSEALESALAALDEVFDLERANKVKPKDWRRADPDAYDLILFSGVEERRALPAGRYLLLASMAPNLPFAVKGESLNPTILRQPQSSQLLRGLDLRDLAINRAQLVIAAPGLEVLLESDAGVLLSRGETESLSFVHLAIEPTSEASSLVLLPAFPLMIQDAALSLSPPPQRLLPPVLAAGARVEIAGHWPTTGGAREVTSMTGESGPDLLNPEGQFQSPERLGRARFQLGEREEDVGLAVLNQRASDLHPRARAAAAPAGPPDREPAQRSLVAYFLGFALTLLALEWLLFSRGWSR